MAEIKFILILLLFIETLQKSDVYFTKIVSSQKIIDMFEKLNIELTGNIGLKVHTGEREGPYFLKPSFLKNIYDYTGGTFIECNTAVDINIAVGKHRVGEDQHGHLPVAVPYRVMECVACSVHLSSPLLRYIASIPQEVLILNKFKLQAEGCLLVLFR